MTDKVYTMIIMEVLKGLKSECEKYECCSGCKFENKNIGMCYFRSCPCDYDLQAIETAVSEMIHEEMNRAGEYHDLQEL